MLIGGFMPFSLSDYPGHPAAVVFTQGCNFRCPFCHNGDLLSPVRPQSQMVPEETVFELLKKRGGRLHGVVITGGEPTLQDDLIPFMRNVHAHGLKVKLDTNGSRPQVVRDVLKEKLADYIAMDIKAPLAAYSRLAGVRADAAVIEESIGLIASSGIPHEFRTTRVEPLLSERDCEGIEALVPPGSRHRWQAFRSENAMDIDLRKHGVES
ncbi:MAG: anaerobic ribonucleoside-triphosphate reductase activating protein [Kiritimatiellia bacterium]